MQRTTDSASEQTVRVLGFGGLMGSFCLFQGGCLIIVHCGGVAGGSDVEGKTRERASFPQYVDKHSEETALL